MKKYIWIIALAALALSCKNTGPADAKEPDGPSDLVESPWEKVDVALPDGIAVYRNSGDLCEKKAVAYYAEADL